MANQLSRINLSLRPLVVLLLPLGLWAMLWLSIQAGSVSNIFNPGNLISWLHDLRAILPFAAGWVAVVLIVAKLSKQRPQGFSFFGPLGLTAVYGLVGITATLLSPDGTVALYWAAAYLSVPLVLWAIVWGGDSPGQIRRIIHFNWLIIILAVVALFAYALLNRDLGDKILNPSLLLECQDRGLWIGQSLRSTGVGRYAAIAGIIALSMLWQPRWRILSGFLLLASLVLLLTTGARGSFVGFAVAAPVVILLLAGRKAMIGGAIVLAVLAPLVWGTGAHEVFLDACALSGYNSTQSDTPVLRTPASSEDLSKQTFSIISLGGIVLKQLGPDEQTKSGELVTVTIPEGVWVHVLPQDAVSPTWVKIPAGVWVIEQPSETSGDVLNQVDIARVPEQGVTLKLLLVENQIAPEISTHDRQIFVDNFQSFLSQTGQPPNRDEPGPTTQLQEQILIPTGFFTATGRTQIWAGGWEFIKRSPLLGYGFHADRLVLGAHIHNAVLHALIQTGFIGTIPFIGAMFFAWLLLLKALRNLNRLAEAHKPLVIQTAGILTFLSVRALPESTGAFFGIDWLLLSPLLLYLHMVNFADITREGDP